MEDIAGFVDLIGNISIVGILGLIVYLFYRGELLSRRVYEDLTKRILKELAREITDGVIAAIQENSDKDKKGKKE